MHETKNFLISGVEVPLRWSNRARYRLSSLPNPPEWQDIQRPAKHTAFIIGHAWAMQVGSNLRYKTPEDLAEAIGEDGQIIEQLGEYICKAAYAVDLPGIEQPAGEGTAAEGEPSAAPSHSPGSSSA